MTKRRWDTALHEAAHAVLGEYFGRRVRLVEIARVKRAHGMTRGTCYFDRRTRFRGKLLEAIAFMAGSAAEQLWCKTEPDWLRTSDADLCRDAGFTNADLVEINDMALVHVRLRRKQIFAVARALMKKDLMGVTVRRLIVENRPKSWGRRAAP